MLVLCNMICSFFMYMLKIIVFPSWKWICVETHQCFLMFKCCESTGLTFGVLYQDGYECCLNLFCCFYYVHSCEETLFSHLLGAEQEAGDYAQTRSDTVASGNHSLGLEPVMGGREMRWWQTLPDSTDHMKLWAAAQVRGFSSLLQLLTCWEGWSRPSCGY